MWGHAFKQGLLEKEGSGDSSSGVSNARSEKESPWRIDYFHDYFQNLGAAQGPHLKKQNKTVMSLSAEATASPMSRFLATVHQKPGDKYYPSQWTQKQQEGLQNKGMGGDGLNFVIKL